MANELVKRYCSYRCKRCGKVFKDNTPMILDSTNILSGLRNIKFADFSYISGYNSRTRTVSLITLHECDNGDVGVAEFIGIERGGSDAESRS